MTSGFEKFFCQKSNKTMEKIAVPGRNFLPLRVRERERERQKKRNSLENEEMCRHRDASAGLSQSIRTNVDLIVILGPEETLTHADMKINEAR